MKGTIIIVDDEPDILLVMTANLKKEGYEVDVTHDFHVGLQQLAAQDYDIIILQESHEAESWELFECGIVLLITRAFLFTITN